MRLPTFYEQNLIPNWGKLSPSPFCFNLRGLMKVSSTDNEGIFNRQRRYLHFLAQNSPFFEPKGALCQNKSVTSQAESNKRL